MTQQQRYRCIPCGLDLAEDERHDCPRLRDEVAANALARVEAVAEILNEATTTNPQTDTDGDAGA